LPATRAARRGARIFGGFLRFLTRYSGAPNDCQPVASHGQRLAARGSPVDASRSRFAVRGSPAGEKLAGFAVRQRAGFSRRSPVAGAGVAVRCQPVAANFPEKLARRSRPAVRR